ncbi:sporulation transcriptional regulator SpoIIID [Caldicellulosiruptoraceae bacterium PP1]
MKGDIEKRVLEAALYIIDEKSTVRDVAKKLGVSKSTVHNDLTYRLHKMNKKLYTEVRQILDKNKAERHLRGGEATRKKYMQKSLLN